MFPVREVEIVTNSKRNHNLLKARKIKKAETEKDKEFAVQDITLSSYQCLPYCSPLLVTRKRIPGLASCSVDKHSEIRPVMANTNINKFAMFLFSLLSTPFCQFSSRSTLDLNRIASALIERKLLLSFCSVSNQI